MKQVDRIKLLEQQLTIFAQEFHDRLDLEDGLRQQALAARGVLKEQLAELRDVYLMHKRHLEETIEIIDMLRRLADQLDAHVAREKVIFKSPEGTSWYKAYKLLSKQSAKTLMRQKREISPYLDDSWKPPSAESWAGLVEHVVEGAAPADAPERSEGRGKRAQPSPRV